MIIYFILFFSVSATENRSRPQKARSTGERHGGVRRQRRLDGLHDVGRPRSRVLARRPVAGRRRFQPHRPRTITARGPIANVRHWCVYHELHHLPHLLSCVRFPGTQQMIEVSPSQVCEPLTL